MSTEASRFTEAFYAVLERNPNKAPGPTAINRELGKEHSSRTPLNTLNGRMSKVRKELLIKNGFTQEAKWGRWRKS